MRALPKAIVGISALAIAAAGIAGTQLVTRPERLAATVPAAAPITTTVAQTTTTRAPTTTPPPVTTTPPPPPPPPPPTTAKPKPSTTQPKPKPAAATPCRATARACIDLSANKSWLLDGAGRVTYGPVSITHGRPGWRTPTGTFRVQWKDIDHESSLFDNAPMPYSVFFNGGIAFHQGSLTELSHGCIHLSATAARTYYNRLRVGDIVQVVP